MKLEVKAKDEKIPYWLIKTLALAVSTIGLTVVMGWIFGISSLQSLLPNFVTMKFSTAISFVMSGIIIFLLSEAKQKNSEWARVLIPGPMMVIAFYMMTLFVSNLVGSTTGIESLFIKENAGAISSIHPGVPSVFTMASFLLLLLASLFSLIGKQRAGQILAIGLIISAISLIAIVGYAIKVPILYYQINNFSTAMALHTAIGLMLTGLALVLFSKTRFSGAKSTRHTSIVTKLTITLLGGILPTLILVSALRYSEGKLIQTLPEVVAIIAFVSVASLLIMRIILTPIIRLKNASVEIEKGNYIVDLSVNQNDEIGELASQFLRMSKSIMLRTRELENANEELRNVQKQKEEFSAMITHELKSSLVPIKGYADLLLGEHLGPLNKQQKDRLMIVRDSSESLHQMISDILDAQKLEMGVLKLNLTENNLADLINEVLVKLRPELDKQQIRVTASLAQNIKCICDGKRIQQILINLLNNALDFCPKQSGKIEINLTADGKDAKISLSDNGPGIALDKLEKIFRKFYQIDSSLTREHGGSGIGLSICKAIVENHKGKIWAESSIGHGATFNIMLPIVKVPSPKYEEYPKMGLIS